MNYYVLQYEVVDDYVNRRIPFRQIHLQKVRDAHARGELRLAGALNDPPDGALFVFRSETAKIAEDFARTFRVLKSLECDVYLGTHGSYYGMAEKFARLKAGGQNPFVDPQGYKDFVAQREQTFLADLASQRAKAEANRKAADGWLHPFTRRDHHW